MSFKLVLVSALIALTNAAALTRRATCPDGVHTATNQACCNWYAVADDLQANLFRNTCEAEVHETLRSTFHDAIGFSPSLSQSGSFGGGGADGSLISFASTEMTFPANGGLADIANELKKFADNHNVSYGDIIQFAGAVGLSNCVGAPQIQTFVGRPAATAASPPNLLPLPTDDVTSILARFNDAGISTANAIWLLASHSVAAQNLVDPAVAGSPFDSTPAKFDTQFYLEVLLKGTFGTTNANGEVEGPLDGELRLQSDFALARDPRTSCLWELPINNQGFINAVFSGAMTQMSLLGQNQNNLIDCTEAVPVAPSNTDATTFPAGKSEADLERNCTNAFPTLSTDPGAATTVAAVPPPNFN